MSSNSKRLSNGIAKASMAVWLVVWQASLLAAPPTESRFAKDSQSLDDFYKSKLSDVNEVGLARCRRSDDVGLALQSTWELVAREAFVRFSDDPEGDVRVGALGWAHRFVGFVEGKLDVDIPAWWIDALLGATLDTSYSLYKQWRFQIDEAAPRPVDIPQYFCLVDRSRWTAVGDIADEIGTLDRIRVGGKDFDLPAALIDRCRINPPSWLLTAESTPEKTLVCVFDDRFGDRGVGLACFDTLNGNHIWTADVWTQPPVGHGGTGLGPTHFLQIVTNETTAYVFGSDEGSAYIEAFSIASGEPLFRFGTRYKWTEY